MNFLPLYAMQLQALFMDILLIFSKLHAVCWTYKFVPVCVHSCLKDPLLYFYKSTSLTTCSISRNFSQKHLQGSRKVHGITFTNLRDIYPCVIIQMPNIQIFHQDFISCPSKMLFLTWPALKLSLLLEAHSDLWPELPHWPIKLQNTLASVSARGKSPVFTVTI